MRKLNQKNHYEYNEATINRAAEALARILLMQIQGQAAETGDQCHIQDTARDFWANNRRNVVLSSKSIN